MGNISVTVNGSFDSAKVYLQTLVKELAEQVPYILNAYIGDRIEEGRNRGFNDGSNVRDVTGRLSRSLIPFADGNITKIENTNDGARVRYGINQLEIKYAAIQEEGGKSPKSGGVTKKQAAYFMARWAEVGYKPDSFEQTMALGARKKHYEGKPFVIPARPYFQPGFERFEKEYLPEAVETVLKEFVKFINR